MDAKARRLENNLYTIGTGVIAFSFWSFAKFVLYFLIFGPEWIVDPEEEYRTAVLIIVWIFAVVIPLLYLWIGLSARAEGKGKRKRIPYLIITGFIALISLLGVSLDLMSFFYSESGIGNVIITFIIDLTRMVFLIELLASSASLRKIKRQQKRGEVTAA